MESVPYIRNQEARAAFPVVYCLHPNAGVDALLVASDLKTQTNSLLSREESTERNRCQFRI